MVERKFFLQIKIINIVYPNVKNKIVRPITKRMEIITSIQVFLLSLMNFDHIENGGKKAFLANPKHQCNVSQCVELACCTNNKMNGDYHVHPLLSHFTAEL